MIAGSELPKEIVDKWPEVFDGIKLNALPLEYLDSISITFLNNKIFDIDLIAEKKKKSWSLIEGDLKIIFNSKSDEIKKINFQMNIEKIKNDVIKSTNRFLKKRNLL